MALDSIFQNNPIIIPKKKTNRSSMRCIWRYCFRAEVWDCQILNQGNDHIHCYSLWNSLSPCFWSASFFFFFNSLLFLQKVVRCACCWFPGKKEEVGGGMRRNRNASQVFFPACPQRPETLRNVRSAANEHSSLTCIIIFPPTKEFKKKNAKELQRAFSVTSPDTDLTTHDCLSTQP
jgi:hypothetical protein